jgi:hypothetical protein
VSLCEYYRFVFSFRSAHKFGSVVVPLGLSITLDVFMCLVNGVFREFLDKFVICFLDDILVYSKTKEEHKQRLRMVLQVLREHQLYSKLSKFISIKRGYIIWAILFQRKG